MPDHAGLDASRHPAAAPCTHNRARESLGPVAPALRRKDEQQDLHFGPRRAGAPRAESRTRA
eukprot:9502582-Heterocapsa_arctica.AAC.1